ncbi:DNA methyltransferase, partial [Escherichia coli]|uniref:DNA methyltransferase n=1 Tax=Escherichia coli TaxID=562 RepID=UPI002222F3AF
TTLFRSKTKQFENGERLTTNIEKSGRYHANWLNMIYPRLSLARNLLRQDGAIFISIDDNEYDNLKKVCDEIF